ncbi:hypothetical protein GCK72_008794 [Caenorhabditis remanei]|uniref:Uncharacterized protein n=1 Tax=Caenorhabditis remanei TaxID=31234 RepID=A0A6A5H0Y4_CAERE|nr:hypothetical protein GCK72_008794 [Caenorhabditis remanei]KAF1760545.1 hypothetical protein GCK72_008794 [Caenorhabditis remanei]
MSDFVFRSSACFYEPASKPKNNKLSSLKSRHNQISRSSNGSHWFIQLQLRFWCSFSTPNNNFLVSSHRDKVLIINPIASPQNSCMFFSRSPDTFIVETIDISRLLLIQLCSSVSAYSQKNSSRWIPRDLCNCQLMANDIRPFRPIRGVPEHHYRVLRVTRLASSSQNRSSGRMLSLSDPVQLTSRMTHANRHLELLQHDRRSSGVTTRTSSGHQKTSRRGDHQNNTRFITRRRQQNSSILTPNRRMNPVIVSLHYCMRTTTECGVVESEEIRRRRQLIWSVSVFVEQGCWNFRRFWVGSGLWFDRPQSDISVLSSRGN